jgi:hypothetical protein
MRKQSCFLEHITKTTAMARYENSEVAIDENGVVEHDASLLGLS